MTFAIGFIAMLTAVIMLATKIVEFQTAREKKKRESHKPNDDTAIPIPISASSRERKVQLLMWLVSIANCCWGIALLQYWAAYGATTLVTFREAALLVLLGALTAMNFHLVK